MTSISAKIIADSFNIETGDRLTTFIVDFPRFFLAEFNTHRALSKSGASSRAIPLSKAIERVETDCFIPDKWGKNMSGMQSAEDLNEEESNKARDIWLEARDLAVIQAKKFEKLGVHKQLASRILEPFMWQKMIVSGTEWQNFFALRAHIDAQPQFQILAYKMLEEYNKSEPKKLRLGEWHIPFGDNIDVEKVENLVLKINDCIHMEAPGHIRETNELIKKIAIARVARISYLNFEGKNDYEADIKLFDKLMGSNPRHATPAEAVAVAVDRKEKNLGNFRGFKQFRKFMLDENAKDSRVKMWSVVV